MAWGHTKYTFDKQSYIQLESSTIFKIDETMDPDKCYAYIYIDDNGKLAVRNLFNSKHKKRFEQKNTYFEDNLFYDLFLDDNSNLLDDYLNLGEKTRLDNDLLYFCVEYEPKHNLDLDLLLYCGELHHTIKNLRDKIRDFEIKNDLKTKKKSSIFSYFW